jgi:esterase/lipase superfamily enzyme
MQSIADLQLDLEQAVARWKLSSTTVRAEPALPFASRIQLIRRAEYLHSLASQNAGGSDDESQARAIELMLRRAEIAEPRAHEMLLALSESIAGRSADAWTSAAEGVARCVGRVVIEEKDGSAQTTGCGVLVAPNMLATTSLVLPDAQAAAHARVEFLMQGSNLARPFRLEPNRHFARNESGLVVVQLEDAVVSAGLGFCPPVQDKGALLCGEGVHVVLFGGDACGPQIRLNDGIVRHLDETDTPGVLIYAGGADMPPPGSAVFNAQWKLVGLQRIGVPMASPEGHVLAVDGTTWSSAGSSPVAWYGQEAALTWQISALIPKRNSADPLRDPEPASDADVLQVNEDGRPPPYSITLPTIQLPGIGQEWRLRSGTRSGGVEGREGMSLPDLGSSGVSSDAPWSGYARPANPSGNIEFADNISWQPRVYERDHKVSLMFATNRVQDNGPDLFSGERSPVLNLGSANVQVPKDHRIGRLELPFEISVFSINIYRKEHSIKNHFTIGGVELLAEEEWRARIGRGGLNEALIFVHGYNTTFNQALYRAAQLFWDLQYTGVPVMFTWPSMGGVLNYIYDKESALGARPHFVELVRKLGAAGIQKIHILAHSMGNLVVLDALATHNHEVEPLQIGELMMAAPDVDRDHYSGIAPRVRAGTEGMTLYASSEDKALNASKQVSGQVARAGDVPGGRPVLVDEVDAIDVSAIGAEMFGLGHAPFATERSLLNDIGLLVGGALRPPSRRLREIRGMPDGQMPVQWWRFVP